jgi:hypothetical protein
MHEFVIRSFRLADQNSSMRRYFEKGPARFFGNLLALVAVYFLLLPASVSVLCIGPGGHVAVEDIDCGVSAGIPAHSAHFEYGQLHMGKCGNCTDLLLPSYGREAVSKPRCALAGAVVSAECPGDSLSHPLILPQSGIRDAALFARFFSSALRC